MRTMAQAFNEWMRRYTDEPERFEAQFRTCGEFLTQVANGEEPTYGDHCAAYLAEIMAEDVTDPKTADMAPAPPAAA